jgi:hypothetical protein
MQTLATFNEVPALIMPATPAVESTWISQFGPVTAAPELTRNVCASGVAVSRMQTLLVEVATAVERTVSGMVLIPITLRNWVGIVDVAEPLSSLPLTENVALAWAPTESKFALNELLARAIFAAALGSRTPASTAVSSAVCIFVR